LVLHFHRLGSEEKLGVRTGEKREDNERKEKHPVDQRDGFPLLENCSFCDKIEVTRCKI